MSDDKVYAVITDDAKKQIVIGIKATTNAFGRVSNFLLDMPNILGGTIDSGESDLEALIREIDEESGGLMDASGLTALPTPLIPQENGANKRGPYTMDFYKVDVTDLTTFGVGDNARLAAGKAANYGQAEMAKTLLVDFSALPKTATDRQITDFLLAAVAAELAVPAKSDAEKTAFEATGTFKAIKQAFLNFPP